RSAPGASQVPLILRAAAEGLENRGRLRPRPARLPPPRTGKVPIHAPPLPSVLPGRGLDGSQRSAVLEVLSESTAPPRFRAALLGTFASLALLLAVLGVYSVVFCATASRTQEIGLAHLTRRPAGRHSPPGGRPEPSYGPGRRHPRNRIGRVAYTPDVQPALRGPCGRPAHAHRRSRVADRRGTGGG